MKQKQKVERDAAQKAIKLLMTLLVSRTSYSLAELSKRLDCSKQTVLRIMDTIEGSYQVQVERSKQGNRSFFRIPGDGEKPPNLNVTESELRTLYMCSTFARHLLGKEFFEEAIAAVDKGAARFSDAVCLARDHYGVFSPGSIDYTPHQKHLRVLIRAMDERKVCKLSYKRLGATTGKTFHIKPLKLFSRKDTVYLHARLAKQPGKQYKTPDFDPLLAVHRITAVEALEQTFAFPKDYDFEKAFNRTFGIIKEDAFDVTVDFSGSAGEYARERLWSPGQKIVNRRDGTIRLTFSATSRPEVVAWILSFGATATLIKPKWLVKEVRREIERMVGHYAGERARAVSADGRSGGDG